MNTRNDYSAIPAEMKRYAHWVGCKAEWNPKREKWDKPPYSIKTGRKADHQKPENRAAFAEAVAAAKNFDGIGFSLTGTEFSGIDLDHCANAETGVIDDWAQIIIDSYASYTEYSFSGTGIHIIVRGKIVGADGHKYGDIEAYSEGRYFLCTGRLVPGSVSTIEDRQDELTAFCARVFPPAAPKQEPKTTTGRASSPSANLSEAALLEKARSAKNGAAFCTLYDRGDLGGHNGDQSAADFALCTRLAWWLGNDHGGIDRAFRSSALMRDKWDERRGECSYGERTISRAVAATASTYNPDMAGVFGEGRRPKSTESKVSEVDSPEAVAVLIGVMPIIARAVAGLPVTLHTMGITVGEKATEIDYAQILRRLLAVKATVDAPLNFAIGDVWRSLPARYGEKRAWLHKHFAPKNAKPGADGLEGLYQTFRKCASIAGRWDTQGMRQIGLPWGFYEEAASLPEERRVELARKYEAGERVTRAAIREEKAAANTAPRLSKDLKTALTALVEVRGEAFVKQMMQAAAGGRFDDILGISNDVLANAEKNEKTRDLHRNTVPPAEQCCPENEAENSNDYGDYDALFESWIDPDLGEESGESLDPFAEEALREENFADVGKVFQESDLSCSASGSKMTTQGGAGEPPCSAITTVDKIVEHAHTDGDPFSPPCTPADVSYSALRAFRQAFYDQEGGLFEFEGVCHSVAPIRSRLRDNDTLLRRYIAEARNHPDRPTILLCLAAAGEESAGKEAACV